ncbi:related to rho coiled-coil associated kinase alpha [Cephalotrichum gorgonifer]|uniref:Related to rho coiled-coil associated kinase alpha n=1 Tax=Cephalotrichum gorgonifer TaxID=2041049 RepID=A0AAE8MZJ8_9PEZI|nr:related to rho coiled-coil associated kinase alpha [Cephalotrichum gorgonifer]
MNANRDNPFNSPPSSTGSHGTVSPTLTSVISDVEGESTRKLNADIARVTGKNFQVNWEAAHRKWPEFYDLPSKRSAAEKSAPSPFAARFDDDSTHDAWLASTRSRAEMQPSVENGSDTSTALSGKDRLQSPSLRLPQLQQHSPLHRAHSRTPSQHQSRNTNPASRRTSASDMLNKLRAASAGPELPRPTPKQAPHRHSFNPVIDSSPTLQSDMDREPPNASPRNNNNINETTARSFCLPDISYLGDFVSGTLRFNGRVKNGVPILVKHGRVVDLATKQPPNNHADVDGLEIPEDEERIFVSMDMIRDEIITLQEHHDGVEKYAEQLQAEVEQLQSQIKRLQMRRSVDSGFGGSEPDGSMYEQLLSEKKRLEEKVTELQRLLDEANRRLDDEGRDNDTLSLERDRSAKKLQEACNNIGELMDKLDLRDRQLQDTQKRLDATLQSKDVNSDLRSEMDTLKHAHDTAVREAASLKETVRKFREEQASHQQEIESLRTDNISLRREQESLMEDNRSLRTNSRNLMTEIESLRKSSDNGHQDISSAKEQIENLQRDIEALEQEKATFREDNDSLVRHNEKYFTENKLLRRENSGFERSLHDLHEENIQLKEDVEFLKQQLDHCRPIARDDDLSGRFTRGEEDENMTSGFIVPDITLHRKDNATADQAINTTELVAEMGMTETEEVTGDQDKSMDIRETIEKDDSIVVQEMNVGGRRRSRSGRDNTSQKVAFSVPEQNGKPKPNVAAKRRSVVRENTTKSDFAGPIDFPLEDSTGYQSTEPTQTQTFSLAMNTKTQTAHSTTKIRTGKLAFNIDARGAPSRAGHRSAGSTRQLGENTVESVASALPDRNACPALSDKARRVLDDLCDHSCKNCVVCARIVSHRGTVSAAERAEGKKRITIPRPVPVTDRPAVREDATMRPSQAPGYALALVIKGLEDEAAHLSMELADLQARYSRSDKSLDRRGRRELAEAIGTMLRRLEVKNDQVYALYDVLEGQKVAGQGMSEEELEVTVFSIAGVSMREVTVTDNVTWNGIDE